MRYSEIAVSRVNSVPDAIRPGFSAFGGSLAIENPWESFYPFNTQALYQVHLLEMTAMGDYKRNASWRYECADGITCPQFLSRSGMRDRYIKRFGNFSTWNDEGEPVPLYSPVYYMAEDESTYILYAELGETTVFGFPFYHAVSRYAYLC